MKDFTSQQAAQALQLLGNRAVDREEELEQYSAADIPEYFYEETDSESPVYDTFFQNGKSEAIMSMTNFTHPEFYKIWNYFAVHIHQTWNIGRGKKSSLKPKDVVFMLLTVCKHGGKCDFLARMFDMKGPTFQRTVMKMLEIVSEYAYTKLVSDKLDDWTMKKLIAQNKLFRTFKFAKYAADVTFQQTNRPGGNIEEAKKYFSGKHKLYGFKVEVSVLPNGLAVGCSDHHPGSTADIDIFYKQLWFHKIPAEKKDGEGEIVDVGLLVEQYPQYWAVLVNKGYQGLMEIFKAVHPHKKQKNKYLTADQESYNKKVASDRIIVENFFGRMCGLWGLVAYKWRWNESIYDVFFRFILPLTNVHIMMHPLREDDVDTYQKFLARTFKIGEQLLTKRKKTQEKYRIKRRRRLALQFNQGSDSEAETLSPK